MKKYRAQQKREKLLQREVAQEVLQHPMDALSLLTSLQKVFGGDDSGGLKARRKALARLRQQKANLRKSIWKQRSRMLSLVSLYKRQLRKQWTDRKVQEDDQRHRIYSLEAKIADLKSRAETQIDGCSWLATVHNFFVAVMAQLSTEIEEDGNDIQTIQRAIDDENIDASGLKKLMLDILTRDQQENLARLAHVQSGVLAAEKNAETMTFLVQASVLAQSKIGKICTKTTPFSSFQFVCDSFFVTFVQQMTASLDQQFASDGLQAYSESDKTSVDSEYV